MIIPILQISKKMCQNVRWSAWDQRESVPTVKYIDSQLQLLLQSSALWCWAGALQITRLLHHPDSHKSLKGWGTCCFLFSTSTTSCPLFASLPVHSLRHFLATMSPLELFFPWQKPFLPIPMAESSLLFFYHCKLYCVPSKTHQPGSFLRSLFSL